MRYGPPFKYAFRPDGRRIAYQVAGDGDLDLVFLFGWPPTWGSCGRTRRSRASSTSCRRSPG